MRSKHEKRGLVNAYLRGFCVLIAVCTGRLAPLSALTIRMLCGAVKHLLAVGCGRFPALKRVENALLTIFKIFGAGSRSWTDAGVEDRIALLDAYISRQWLGVSHRVTAMVQRVQGLLEWCRVAGARYIPGIKTAARALLAHCAHAVPRLILQCKASVQQHSWRFRTAALRCFDIARVCYAKYPPATVLSRFRGLFERLCGLVSRLWAADGAGGWGWSLWVDQDAVC